MPSITMRNHTTRELALVAAYYRLKQIEKDEAEQAEVQRTLENMRIQQRGSSQRRGGPRR